MSLRAFDSLLEPGRNCWRLERAERLSVLVDGEAYFDVVRQAMIQARRRIAIAGWDLHSQVRLIRDGTDDGHPVRLGELLCHLLDRNPDLEVCVLLWDYAPIYALERESLLLGDHPWGEHPRMRFVKDASHPPLASQHQKLVAIDGRIAFCGGFDLSQWRWDTNAHPPADARRVDPDGEPYQPFHDLQMLVDGPAATAIMDLFQDRWRWATGEVLEAVAPSPEEPDPWPRDVAPMLTDTRVGIARTLPAYEDRPESREVERLYLDMIDRARDFIYIENQYLTSRSLVRALCRSLQRRKGPQLVVILPQRTGAWIEQHTMDVLRARMLERMRRADRHDRLAVYYPDVQGLDDGCLMVHAKLMIADDAVLRIGSSNLSNRSMGLDSECDLCVVAEDPEEVGVIRALRQRLLGIFLSVEPERLDRAERQARERGEGLLQAIERLREQPSAPDAEPPIRLSKLDGEVDPEWNRQLPDERILDPDRPIDGDLVTQVVVGGEAQARHARWRLVFGTLLVTLFVALAAAWRWTGLGDWLTPESLASLVQGLSHAYWGPPVAVAAFVLAAVLAVPVTLLILASVLVFGSVTGAVVALAGATLSAYVSYGIGSYLGRPAVERMSGGGLGRLSRRLARYGVLTVVTVRIVPVAPFVVINLFAGASHLRLRDFMIGTAIGMTPAILAMAIFAEGLMSLIGKADLRAVALVFVGVLAIAGLTWYGRRMLADDR
ncbi:Phospholipase D/Transphosphatidylase [Imhoffiella purpurea]|uniref:Phospholipase D/Transphosphatidylase n=1 Tax=Imhoffiella purpurea TaxID=1249627 RepID=W9V5F3_9GAMM|nr:Phospholipase D/Transphosphatidylase [Imhoffiella purpurea]